MERWMIWLAVTIAMLSITTLIYLYFRSRSYLRQAQSREQEYQERRRRFRAELRSYQCLPFYPWKNNFPRLEPFHENDQRVIRADTQARKIMAAYFELPGWLSKNNDYPATAGLLDVSGNIRRIRLWEEEKKYILAAGNYSHQLEAQRKEVEQLFRDEMKIRQSIAASFPLQRQRMKELESASRELEQNRLAQIQALIALACAAMERAESTEYHDPAATPLPADDGVSFSLAQLCSRLAETCFEHILLLDAIHSKTEQVNEVNLLEQFDGIYPSLLHVASLPIERDWDKLRYVHEALSNQRFLLKTLEDDLQKELVEATEYWKKLEAFAAEVKVEITRVESTEKALEPYLGSIESSPQAWEAIIREPGRVSDKLKLLAANVHALLHSDGARRATDQNRAMFEEHKQSYTKFKVQSQAVQDALYATQKEHHRLEGLFEKNGTAEKILQLLQRAAADCPPENQVNLENLIYRILGLKEKITPRPGVNYTLLAEQWKHLQNEGKQVLRIHKEQLASRRSTAANTQGMFEEFHTRYSKLRRRIPSVEKDWSTIDQWVDKLASFNITQAGFRDIDAYLKAFHEGRDTFDLELRMVEQQYIDFTERAQKIMKETNRARETLTEQASMLETSPWKLVFHYAIGPLREHASTYGRYTAAVEAAFSIPHMSDAVSTLDQIERSASNTYAQVQKLIESYAEKFNDLMTMLRLYQDMRDKFISRATMNGTGTIPLSTADDYRNAALSTSDYSTARQALNSALKVFGYI